ncbi:PaaI family thioesterase [Fulvivirga lutea]|uniref:PaaI family thioesterase n=1 Tax=Fulvivirga lutea TaxID=2810512 RepID=A0A975A254_9BACT|nr:PaaI family thioesterase [Fulvivirga lutea]QSE99081.1 PaaI family thioesterase [Fulvivirga lutea]
MQVFNPDYKSLIKQHLEKQHFMKHIGFQLSVIEPGIMEGTLKLEEHHKQQRGFAHGGLVATLADITAGFAAYSLVPPEHHVVTGELKISYLNPGVGEELYAKGWVLKQGKKINFCEAEVWSISGDERVLIAKASASMITIFPGDFKK